MYVLINMSHNLIKLKIYELVIIQEYIWLCLNTSSLWFGKVIKKILKD